MRSMLGEAVKTRLHAAAVAAQTAINSTVILDMSGFDAACFDVLLGTVTDTCVLTVTVMENTASSTSGATAVTGAAVSFTASTNTITQISIDVIRPTKRYVYVNVTRTTANAVIDGITATQYRSRAVPTTQPATLSSATSTPEV